MARPGQIIQSIPADLTQSSTSTEALDKSAERHGGRTPDHVYLCAGFSKPKFMIDSTEDEFKGVSLESSVCRRSAEVRLRENKS